MKEFDNLHFVAICGCWNWKSLLFWYKSTSCCHEYANGLKKVCRNWLLISYSLFDFARKSVFKGGFQSPHCVPGVRHFDTIVNKTKPRPGFKWMLVEYVLKKKKLNNSNNNCYSSCCSKQRQVTVVVEKTVAVIIVAKNKIQTKSWK